jgi:iron complex transport system substrate-binding protein
LKQILYIFLIAVSLLSCTGHQTKGLAETGDTVVFRYARLLTVEQRDGYRMVTIQNPWKEGKVLHRYRLVPYDAVAQHQTERRSEKEEGATVVRVPLRRSVIFTSVHAALMGQLGAQQQVAGVADLKYMKVPYVQQGVQSGRITDCGDGMSPVVEKIIDAEADGILLSPFENSGGYGRLEDINIPLIECAEYMEQSPLARAEWVRFYGMLYGKEREADSLFALVDSSYHALKALAAKTDNLQQVLMDKQTGPVWYVPGGRSTIGQMLRDANCHYPFDSDDHSGSLPLPFETVLEKCGEADVWLFRYDSRQPITKAQLSAEQPGYGQLRPMRKGSLYGCNVMTSMFYEETPFRPDLLLQDFVQILHPELRGMPPLRYYQKVE